MIALERVTVSLEKLPSAFVGFTIAFLSDFHLRGNATLLQEARELLKQESYDLCLLGGDYVERAHQLAVLKNFLKTIALPNKTFAVKGNHEYYGDMRLLQQVFKETGVHLLDNQSVRISKKGQSVDLIGVSPYLYDDPKVSDESDLPKALKGSSSACKILLSHSPDIILKEEAKQCSLVLSGHTHGGQICLPGIGALYTSTRIGRAYASGLFSIDGLQLYVTRGLGTSKVFSLPSPRIRCMPEITLIRLVKDAT
ncbi:MAG: metallophosphoesterase [Candidatus Woesearchaeota archaeon]|nr:MAG: metallophosphoesterase [Candidatus Woesearchaeota archaeon]